MNGLIIHNQTTIMKQHPLIWLCASMLTIVSGVFTLMSCHDDNNYGNDNVVGQLLGEWYVEYNQQGFLPGWDNGDPEREYTRKIKYYVFNSNGKGIWLEYFLDANGSPITQLGDLDETTPEGNFTYLTHPDGTVDITLLEVLSEEMDLNQTMMFVDGHVKGIDNDSNFNMLPATSEQSKQMLKWEELFHGGGDDDDPLLNTNNPVTHYTLTVNATNGEDANTRALRLDGNTLNSYWEETDRVKVYKDDSEIGELAPTLIVGKSCTLIGTIDTPLKDGDTIVLKYHNNDYAFQEGTIAFISANCSYAIATVTVKMDVEAGSYTADAHFINQQAIVEFKLKDKATAAFLNPSSFVIKYGSDLDTTITLSDLTDTTYETNGDGILYVAIPAITQQPVILTAGKDGKTYTYENPNVTFENSMFYGITVSLGEPKTGVNDYTYTTDSGYDWVW